MGICPFGKGFRKKEVMQMNTTFLLLAQYGKAVVSIEEVAPLFGWVPKTAQNRVCAGTFPVHTFKLGHHICVRIQDLAEYIDHQSKIDSRQLNNDLMYSAAKQRRFHRKVQ